VKEKERKKKIVFLIS